MDAVQTSLERVLAPAVVSTTELERLVQLLEQAVEGCGYEGRALAAAWSAVPRTLTHSAAARVLTIE